MNNRSLSRAVALCLAVLPLGVAAHGPEDASREALGKVSFPTSCGARVQPAFERGVAALHSYWFPEAKKAFEAVLAQEPACAMAHWGIAVALLENSLSAPPPAADLEAAWATLERARALGTATPRERDWIEAVSAYYRDHDKVAVDLRLAAYTRALEEMTRRYPGDDEVWSFYALMLQASAPKSDKTYANQRKSAEILERLFAKNPQHPGAAHYLIHAYDYPPLADKGIRAAGLYAKIAPAAPHARHMPSHIYSMVGMWEESVASNRAALDARPDYYHAMDFMTYAYLQMGQDAKAHAMLAEMRAVAGGAPVKQGHTAVASIPARCALERGDWKAAAALPVTDLRLAHADSLTRFARGLGMARAGNLVGARAEVTALKELKQSLDKSSSYWAARTEEQVYAVSAWIARAEGDRERSETLMRAAADGEDASVKHVQMENRLYPMRELLADLLLENGKSREALDTYRAALAETPNRYRALYGAAVAANAVGERAAAASYSRSLVELTRNADGGRPEIARAREMLARQ